MKKYISFTLTLLFTLTFINVVQAQQNIIKIGWVGPLTGASAVLGVDSLKATQMALEEINSQGGINGSKLQLVVEDDQYATAKTVAAYQKLVSLDGVKFIFVLTYGGVFAVADRARRDNVVIVDPLDCNDRIGALNNHVLCVAKTTEGLGIEIADHVVKHTNTPVGLLYFEADPFPKETAEHAYKRLKELGVTPVVYEGYTADTSDFRPLIQRLKATKVKSLIMYGYDEMGLLARQARDLGLKVQLYSFGTVTSPGFLDSAQGSAEGLILVNWVGEGGDLLQKFLSKFRESEKRDPLVHISTLPSYDVAKIVAACFAHGSMEDNVIAPEKLLKCLYETKDYAGISGKITIDPDGVTRSFHQVLSVLKGSKVNAVSDLVVRN